jgi:hypothetical protein
VHLKSRFVFQFHLLGYVSEIVYDALITYMKKGVRHFMHAVALERHSSLRCGLLEKEADSNVLYMKCILPSYVYITL